MTSLVIPVQMTAMLTAAVLVSICLASVGKSQVRDSRKRHKSLVKIVEQLEQKGYGPFSEISKDDGYWEVDVNRDGVAYELTVDPKSGKVLAEHRDGLERIPPKEALPLSKLLDSLLSGHRFRDIDEVSFEPGYWEIEVFKNREKHEIHVDPLTAKVVADRIDD